MGLRKRPPRQQSITSNVKLARKATAKKVTKKKNAAKRVPVEKKGGAAAPKETGEKLENQEEGCQKGD